MKCRQKKNKKKRGVAFCWVNFSACTLASSDVYSKITVHGGLRGYFSIGEIAGTVLSAVLDYCILVSLVSGTVGDHSCAAGCSKEEVNSIYLPEVLYWIATRGYYYLYLEEERGLNKIIRLVVSSSQCAAN